MGANQKSRYNIQVGQIYIATDGSKCGHIVTDITTYADCDDVVTTPFTASKMGVPGNRIDSFKLAMVRYNFAAEKPDWFPIDNQELKMDSSDKVKKAYPSPRM